MAAIHKRREVPDIVADNVPRFGYDRRCPYGFVVRVFEPRPGSRPNKLPDRKQTHDRDETPHSVSRLCEHVLAIWAVPAEPSKGENPPGFGDDPLRPDGLEPSLRSESLQDQPGPNRDEDASIEDRDRNPRHDYRDGLVFSRCQGLVPRARFPEGSQLVG